MSHRLGGCTAEPLTCCVSGGFWVQEDTAQIRDAANRQTLLSLRGEEACGLRGVQVIVCILTDDKPADHRHAALRFPSAGVEIFRCLSAHSFGSQQQASGSSNGPNVRDQLTRGQ